MKFFLALLSVLWSYFTVAAQSCTVEVVQGPPTFYSGDGGPATQAAIIGTTSLAFDSKGNLYLAQPTAHRIRRISPNGIITTVAGNGTRGPAVEGAIATQTPLDGPSVLTVDSADRVYFADGTGGRLRRLNSDGTLQTVAGFGAIGFNAEQGPATGIAIGQISALAAAPDGSIYLADRTNARLRRLRPNGVIETVAGSVTANRPTGQSSDPLAIQFLANDGIAVDTQGRVYAILFGISGLSRLTPADNPANGKLDVLDLPNASDYYNLASGIDHRLLLSGYHTPLSIVSESGTVTPVTAAPPGYYTANTKGTIYALQPQGLVQRIDGSNLTQVAGSIFSPKNIDGGPALQGGFNFGIGPRDRFASDAGGNLLRIDLEKKQLWRITPGGDMRLIAGNGTTTFDPSTKPALQTGLNFPTAVALGPDRLPYLAERSAIRRLRADGNLEVVTLTANLAPALNLPSGFNSVQPSAIALAADGVIYLLDPSLPGYFYVVPGGQIVRVSNSQPYTGLIAAPNGQVYGYGPSLWQLNRDAATLLQTPPYSNPTFTSTNVGFGFGYGEIYRIDLNGPALRLNDQNLSSLGLNPGFGFVGSNAAVAATPSGDIYLLGDQMTFLVHRPESCRTAPPPMPSPGGLVNAANFGYQGKISPGTVITLFGQNLGSAPGFGGILSGSGRALLKINDTSVAGLPMVYASPTQVSFISSQNSTVAFGPPPSLSITVNGLAYPYPDPIQMVEATPALFTAGSTGSGQAASLNQDGSANSAANPIARGQVIQLFGTGFGKLSGTALDGTIATPPYPTLTLPVKIQVGGKPTTVEYAGAAPGLLLGIVQINIRIPADAPTGPSVPLTIQVSSTLAEQSVSIAIK